MCLFLFSAVAGICAAQSGPDSASGEHPRLHRRRGLRTRAFLFVEIEVQALTQLAPPLSGNRVVIMRHSPVWLDIAREMDFWTVYPDGAVTYPVSHGSSPSGRSVSMLSFSKRTESPSSFRRRTVFKRRNSFLLFVPVPEMPSSARRPTCSRSGFYRISALQWFACAASEWRGRSVSGDPCVRREPFPRRRGGDRPLYRGHVPHCTGSFPCLHVSPFPIAAISSFSR